MFVHDGLTFKYRVVIEIHEGALDSVPEPFYTNSFARAECYFKDCVDKQNGVTVLLYEHLEGDDKPRVVWKQTTTAPAVVDTIDILGILKGYVTHLPDMSEDEDQDDTGWRFVTQLSKLLETRMTDFYGMTESPTSHPNFRAWNSEALAAFKFFFENFEWKYVEMFYDCVKIVYELPFIPWFEMDVYKKMHEHRKAK